MPRRSNSLAFTVLLKLLNSDNIINPQKFNHVTEMNLAVISHFHIIQLKVDFNKRRFQKLLVQKKLGNIKVINVHINNFT